MSNYSTFAATGGGGGAPGGGIEGTNCFTIASGTPSIGAGKPISYSISSDGCVDKTIELTQGDPTLFSITGNHNTGVCGYTFNCSPFCSSNEQQCYQILNVAAIAGNGNNLEIVFRTGQDNFFRMSKGGTTGYLNGTHAASGTKCLSIACTGLQNLEYSSANLCLNVASEDYVAECNCSGDFNTFNCSSWSHCFTPTVPANSYTLVCCTKRCCGSGGSACCTCYSNSAPCHTLAALNAQFGLSCSYNTSGRSCQFYCKTQMVPYEVANGSMVFCSCSGDYWYVAIPTQRTGCYGSGCCYCTKLKCYHQPLNANQLNPGLLGGMQLWKFQKCSSGNQLCTTPVSIDCDVCGNWRLGNLTKNGNLMYGSRSKIFHCQDCCNCHCRLHGCEYFYVEEVDSNVCLNPASGCIPSTNRTMVTYFCANNPANGDVTLEGERKFWPMSEDENGWVLWTEPVHTIHSCKCSNCMYKGWCGSYMRVGAFKPTGQGTGVVSSNIQCMCHNAELDGAFCIGHVNGVLCCCCDSTSPMICMTPDCAIAGCYQNCNTFGGFLVMLDEHPFFHGNATQGNQVYCASAPSFFCCNGGSNTFCTCKFLPQGAIHTGCFDSASCEQWFLMAPMWVAGKNCNAFAGFCCSQSIAASGCNVCFRFCVDNTTCCLYLLGCVNDVTALTNFNTSTNTQPCAGAFCVLPQDIFKFGDNSSRKYFVNGWLTETRYRPISNDREFVGDRPSLRHSGKDYCQNIACLRETFSICAQCPSSCNMYCDSRPVASAYNWSSHVYHNTMAFTEPDDLTTSCVSYTFGVCCIHNSDTKQVSFCCCGPCNRGQERFDSYSNSNRSGFMGPAHRQNQCFFGTDVHFQYLHVCGCGSCLCLQNRYCIYIKCKATGACTSCNVNCYYGTFEYMPQDAKVVGSDCHVLFFNYFEDDLRYSVATKAEQNNSCQWMGFASEAGTAGDTIPIATLGNGTAPIPTQICQPAQCFRLTCPLLAYSNHTCPAFLSSCFSINNPSTLPSSSKMREACCIVLCQTFDPTTDCCKMYLTHKSFCV